MRAIRYTLKLVLLAVIVLGVGTVAYYEPDTLVGSLYAKTKYDPNDKNLQTLASHLWEVEGGSLGDRLDAYIFERLRQSKRDSQEYRNILGFYADQAVSSRAGSRIFEDGHPYLDSIIEYGRSAKDQKLAEAYLFLAFGVATRNQCYKPVLDSSHSLDENYDLIESENYAKVGIKQL